MVNNFTKYNVKVIYLFYKKQTTLVNYLTSSRVIMIGQGKEVISNQIHIILTAKLLQLTCWLVAERRETREDIQVFP